MRNLFFAAVLALGTSVAQAMPVQYEFTITNLDPQLGFPSGPVADGSGFIAFDPELFAPASGEGRVQDSTNGLPTLSLSLDWLGQHFDESGGSLWAVEFFGGIPDYWAFGGKANACGVPNSTFGCVSAGTTDFEVTGLANNSGSVVMALDGVPGYGFGTIQWQQVPYASVPTPEPGTFGIMLLGLASVWLLRRKSVRN